LRTKTHQNIESYNKRKRPRFRRQLDILRSSAATLSGKDRLIMKMYLENCNSFRQIARLAGVNEVTIARRIQRISNRLMTGSHITSFLHHQNLTEFDMKIANDYFIEGLTHRKITARRNCSIYHVRKTLQKIQRMVGLEARQAKNQKGTQQV
jgi:predicted DNA-binding protein YlxM (UPF0122 family)